MSTIRIIYIVLHIWEIWMLFIAGKKMSKTKTDKEYWKASVWAFVPYIVVLGLRFGHNIDWNLYYERYMEHNIMDWATTEPIYHLMFYIFNVIGTPYFLVITFQVTFFMYSFLLLSKYFKNCLYYVLPLLPVVALSNDNYIRWYLALSFALVAIYWFLSDSKSRILKTLIYFTVSFLIHNGTILLLLLLPVFMCLKNKYIPVKISLVAIFISVFFMSIVAISFLSQIGIFIYSQGGSVLQDVTISKYLLLVSDIANEGLTDITGIRDYKLHQRLITFFAFAPVVVYGPKILKKYKYGILFYNIFIIGAFLNPFFSTVEIFDRYSKALLIFQAIVSGIVYYQLLFQNKYSKSIKIFCFISMMCCFYPFIRYTIFMRHDYRMMYIWDAGNKKCINTDLYINDMLKND